MDVQILIGGCPCDVYDKNHNKNNMVVVGSEGRAVTIHCIQCSKMFTLPQGMIVS